MNNLEIYKMIFDDVFCKTFTQSFFIFLCGGADKRHIRNKIRIQLETNGLQVLYPEDLFMDMLNRDKKADLLEYENLLASNSDIVCIILTSRKICQLITPQLRYLYLLQTCFCIQNEAHRIAVSSVQ